jgi:hypothetical protein
MRRRLTAEGSSELRSVRENCHHILDAGCAPLVLDHLPKLLIDDSHLGGGGRVVAYARETQEIAWKL